MACRSIVLYITTCLRSVVHIVNRITRPVRGFSEICSKQRLYYVVGAYIQTRPSTDTCTEYGVRVSFCM